jgi:hypothetical protein
MRTAGAVARTAARVLLRRVGTYGEPVRKARRGCGSRAYYGEVALRPRQLMSSWRAVEGKPRPQVHCTYSVDEMRKGRNDG